MEALLTYALNKKGLPVHVDHVARGKACGCHCPYCKKPLSAKKGEWRQHHFAHVGKRKCEGAYETMLHILSKTVFLEDGKIMLPSSASIGFPTGLVKLHNVQIEKWDNQYRIKPDAEGVMENGERLLVEFVVSHKVEGKKRQIIIDNHLKCIVIDLNYQLLDKEELRKFITKSKDFRYWVTPVQSVQYKPNSSGSSGTSPRNPVYGVIRDRLKRIYDQETLRFHPLKSSKNQCTIDSSDMVLDLKELGYDVCDMHFKYRGLKHDLLFTKSIEEGKRLHAVSINVRGRSRKKGFKAPKGLLIIDIVLKYRTTVDDIQGYWGEADIYKTEEVKTDGLPEWLSEEGRFAYETNNNN